jgi:hypothetical protein
LVRRLSRAKRQWLIPGSFSFDNPAFVQRLEAGHNVALGISSRHLPVRATVLAMFGS